ncbi:type I-G CRISPR-associated protein Cas8g1/Csx17 [Aminivibrio sp.]|jgi:CRISPR-associated protein Csx17|uniref:type I-G CRISPR-associated protein Cas8g1/Csx17 n=1 Tax=Aminivibrio sp. TaxID=1872489 RepID=UPI003D96A9C3
MSVRLEGCGITPLSGYLKALGVMRIVSQQLEPSVQGAWRGDCFILAGSLEEDSLSDFLLKEYSPTPIVAPWNGGSGFNPNDDKSALNAILALKGDRFKPYVSVIREILSWPEIPSPPDTVEKLLDSLEAEAGRKGETKEGDKIRALAAEIRAFPPGSDPTVFPTEKKQLEKAIESLGGKNALQDSSQWRMAVKKGVNIISKAQRSLDKTALLNACRARLPEEILDWFDAAYALTGTDSASFAPVLGSGANDGRLEFTNNFMKRVLDVLVSFPEDKSRELLEASLFGRGASGLIKGKIGFYDPGRAGGYNQGAGIEKKDFFINPWDYVLLFEGLPVLAASVTRRAGQAGAYISSPFTARHTRVGYVSAGGEKDRNETWLPVWDNPASYREIRFLFREGRSTLGRRVSRTGLDFVRSARTLGVDRGIRFFQRYVYLERRGNNYVALPAGVIAVKEQKDVAVLNEADSLLRSLDGFLGGFGQNVPSSFSAARRRIDACLFACAEEPNPARFRNLVRSFGAMEQLIVKMDNSNPKKLKRPLTGLSPRWVALCSGKEDALPEVFLAGALSSIMVSGKVGPLRTYLSGVDSQNPRSWSRDGHRFWSGISLEERLCRLVMRRQMDAGRLRVPAFPAEGHLRLNPEQVVPFLEKRTDDALLEELLWGFLWIDWRKSSHGMFPKGAACSGETPVIPRIWALMKLCHAPERIGDRELPLEPRIAQNLFAGRMEEAERIAVMRLRGSGYIPHPVVFSEACEPRRILASLLFPVRGTFRLAGLVLKESSVS